MDSFTEPEKLQILLDKCRIDINIEADNPIAHTIRDNPLFSGILSRYADYGWRNIMKQAAYQEISNSRKIRNKV